MACRNTLDALERQAAALERELADARARADEAASHDEVLEAIAQCIPFCELVRHDAGIPRGRCTTARLRWTRAARALAQQV